MEITTLALLSMGLERMQMRQSRSRSNMDFSLNNYEVKGKPMRVEFQDNAKRRKDPE
jgi:hypothetical protein